jgi:hypothetical protein
MNPENEERREEFQETSTGSFYEPRTIPKKWDVSAFVSHSTSAGKGKAEQPAEPINQPESELPDEESATRNPDPFPQPRTVPGKWDVSELK